MSCDTSPLFQKRSLNFLEHSLKSHSKEVKIQQFLEKRKNISLLKKSDNFHSFREVFLLFFKNSYTFHFLEIRFHSKKFRE